MAQLPNAANTASPEGRAELHLELRPAEPADRAFVRALSETCFAALGDYQEIIEGWFDHPGVQGRIALVEGAPAGYVLVALMRERLGAVPVPYIVAIAVEPDHRGVGVGRQLLGWAVGETRRWAVAVGAPAVELSVAESNRPARALFEREGFAIDDSRATCYPAGQNCLRMTRLVTAGMEPAQPL